MWGSGDALGLSSAGARCYLCCAECREVRERLCESSHDAMCEPPTSLQP